MDVSDDTYALLKERHRQMMEFLTVVALEDDVFEAARVLKGLDPLDAVGLIFSLGTTLEGTLRYIAHRDGITFEEQLQNLALQTETMTKEDLERYLREADDG